MQMNGKKLTNMIHNFYIEVHYEDSEVQSNSIKRVICEKHKPVYAMRNQGGLIVKDGVVKTLGEVRLYK